MSPNPPLVDTPPTVCDPAWCRPDRGCEPGRCGTNETLYARALDVLPGGVSSPVRAFRSVGGTPFFVQRAEGAWVWDVEGKRYCDFVQSYGAVVLGHAHPAVVAAIGAAAAAGTSYGAPTAREVLLGEEIRRRVPSCEKVRFVNSGTEATMTAVRLARGVTGRRRVVVFAGNYHGHGDTLLAAGGSGLATLGLPASVGVPPGAVADTVVVPYNVVPDLGDDVACVLVEPVAANMGLVPPAPGFLEGLRAACDAAGALLVFDEVITGFRLGIGGAQERYGVRPDLSCFGKVIGGGVPIGAVGGRAELMDALAPVGSVYQAGTLSGNPLATAAGLAVLEHLDVTAYRMLDGRAALLAKGLAEVIAEAGFAVAVPRVGPLVGLYFGDEAPGDYDAARRTDTAAYGAFFHALLERGVFVAPGPYEVLFCGLAHTSDDIERTIDVAAAAAKAAAVALGR